MSKLNRLYWIKQEIKQLEEQLEELTTISAKPITDMPTSKGTSSPVESFVHRKMQLQDKLVIQLNKYITERDRIEDEIQKIEDAEVRVIARMRIIENKKFEDIGYEVGMDRTTAYRKLKKYFKGEM